MRQIARCLFVIGLAQFTLFASDLISFSPQFEPDRGQSGSKTEFVSRGNGYSLELTRKTARLRLRSSAPNNATPDARADLRLELLKSSRKASPIPMDPLPGVTNYAIGSDPRRWIKSVPSYSGVRYPNVYPGIAWLFHGSETGFEFDFVVDPGANPADIAFRIDGSASQRIDSSGNLILATPAGDVQLRRPTIYQESGGVRSEIEGGLVIAGRNQYSFRIGLYDSAKPLIIDPQIRYASFLRGAASAIAVDSLGAVYITGSTLSTDFPVLGAFQAKAKGNGDAFVAKLDSAGNVVWSTYLGSTSRNDSGTGIALDGSGNVYVAGTSLGTDISDFPTTPGTLSPKGAGVFVTRFNPQGVVVFSTFLNNPNSISAAIAVDRTGNSYIATSDIICTGNPGALAGHGGPDAALRKLDPVGATLIYSVCIGGNGVDWSSSIAVDAQGAAYIAGQTGSADFPIVNPIQAHLSGSNNGFIAKVNPAGTALVYSSYLGQDATAVYAIAVDAAGVAYLAGRAPVGFSYVGPSLDEGAGGFFCEVAPSGGSLTYASPLAIGANMGIAVDATGTVYVAGASGNGFVATPGAAVSQGFGEVARIGEVRTALRSVVSSASFQPGPVAPGELVSLFGNDMGTLSLSVAAPDKGFYPTSLAGTTVLFDGTPAPLVFTRSDQVGAIVPWSVSGKTTTQVQVSWQGFNSPALAVPVAESALGIFTADGSGTGQVAALNQDGSLNTLVNPAARGSIIVFYATGAGVMTPAVQDGSVTVAPYPAPVLPIVVGIDYVAVENLYVGAAPGLVSGVIQINARIPQDAPVGDAISLLIRIGNAFSPIGTTIAIR